MKKRIIKFLALALCMVALVGCSSNEKEEASEITTDTTATVSPSAEETPSAEPSETTSTESADSSAISDDITAQVEELNVKYDNIIEKVNGFSSDPSTYTLTAYTEFMRDYTDIITDLGEISEAINESGGAVSSWEGYDIYMSILVKNTELSTAVSALPSDIAS